MVANSPRKIYRGLVDGLICTCFAATGNRKEVHVRLGGSSKTACDKLATIDVDPTKMNPRPPRCGKCKEVWAEITSGVIIRAEG